MADFGYSRRADEVEQARARVNAARAKIRKRGDPDDPQTMEWAQALTDFTAALDRVYPSALAAFARGDSPLRDVPSEIMLDFIEADPIFFRSGYMKEKLLTELKRRRLTSVEVQRLRRCLLAVVEHSPATRQFAYYCRAARTVDGDEFRAQLAAIAGMNDADAAARANRMLAALG